MARVYFCVLDLFYKKNKKYSKKLLTYAKSYVILKTEKKVTQIKAKEAFPMDMLDEPQNSQLNRSSGDAFNNN